MWALACHSKLRAFDPWSGHNNRKATRIRSVLWHPSNRLCAHARYAVSRRTADSRRPACRSPGVALLCPTNSHSCRTPPRRRTVRRTLPSACLLPNPLAPRVLGAPRMTLSRTRKMHVGTPHRGSPPPPHSRGFPFRGSVRLLVRLPGLPQLAQCPQTSGRLLPMASPRLSHEIAQAAALRDGGRLRRQPGRFGYRAGAPAPGTRAPPRHHTLTAPSPHLHHL